MHKVSVYSDGAIGYGGKLYASMADVIGVLPRQGEAPHTPMPVAFENKQDYELTGKIIYSTARLGVVHDFAMGRFAFDFDTPIDPRPPH